MDLRLISVVAAAGVSAGVITFGVLAANALEPKTDASTLSISESDATVPAVPQLSSSSAGNSGAVERAVIQLANVTEVPPVLVGNAAVWEDRQRPPKGRYDALRLSWDRGRLPAGLHSSHMRPRAVFEPRVATQREEHHVPRMALILGVAF